MLRNNLLNQCLLLGALMLSPYAGAQITLLPDPNFELALIDLGLDDALDGQVTTSNIASVEGLNVDDRSISDLTGIQAFGSLSNLSCKQNLLTTLDVSQNAELVVLDCRLNLLTDIDVGQNSLLQTLRCSDNSISTLDLSMTPLLRYLYCSNDPLTGLDLSSSPDLYWLDCENAGLTSLDVSQNMLLNILHCSGNELSTLDLVQNVDLHTLECSDNQLVSIDLGAIADISILNCENNLLTGLETGNLILLEVLNCDANQIVQLDLVSNCLQGVSCDNNQMEHLDMSQSTAMSELHCSNNPPLQWIDLRNSFTSTIGQVVALDDPNLTCIYVDDATYDHGLNWQFDTLSAVIVETEAECMMFLEVSEYDQVNGSVLYPNPANGHFSIKTKEQVNGINIYDINGQIIQSFPYQATYSIELPTGVYMVNIDYPEGVEVKILLVE